MSNKISADDHDDIPKIPASHQDFESQTPIPASPPPSFRSRASSPTSRHLLSEDPIASDAERTLADTFDDGSDSDHGEIDGRDDRQRLMHSNDRSLNEGTNKDLGPSVHESTTEPPNSLSTAMVPLSRGPGAVARNQFASVNDGVFANLNAKPERGEKLEEQPPVSYYLHLELSGYRRVH